MAFGNRHSGHATSNTGARWGIAAKRFMRENYGRIVHVQGPVQEKAFALFMAYFDARLKQ